LSDVEIFTWNMMTSKLSTGVGRAGRILPPWWYSKCRLCNSLFRNLSWPSLVNVAARTRRWFALCLLQLWWFKSFGLVWIGVEDFLIFGLVWSPLFFERLGPRNCSPLCSWTNVDRRPKSLVRPWPLNVNNSWPQFHPKLIFPHSNPKILIHWIWCNCRRVSGPFDHGGEVNVDFWMCMCIRVLRLHSTFDCRHYFDEKVWYHDAISGMVTLILVFHAIIL
jgi:hypothetical protein